MPDLSAFQTAASDRAFDKIIIAGGGPAAVFTAYEILRQAQDAGKKIDVLVLADKISTPCQAGSHITLSVDGLFHDDGASKEELKGLLRSGMKNLQNTVAREQIDCRLSMGYEIKANSEEALEAARRNLSAKIYKAEELELNTGDESFHLTGSPHSLKMNCIGQVNMPDLVNGLIQSIERMGGKIIEGVRYQGQERDEKGNFVVRTNLGDFKTGAKPLLATGGVHQRTLPDFPFKTRTLYATALVYGPLSRDDAQKISDGPMAIADTSFSENVFWATLDPQKYLVVGGTDLPASDDPLERPPPEVQTKLIQEIEEGIEKRWPGIVGEYKRQISFGPMLLAENEMPIVGRLKDYDVIGGWGGRGIVPGYAAAQAYAKYIVQGNDRDLKIFEALQPKAFHRSAAFEPDYSP